MIALPTLINLTKTLMKSIQRAKIRKHEANKRLHAIQSICFEGISGKTYVEQGVFDQDDDV